MKCCRLHIFFLISVLLLCGCRRKFKWEQGHNVQPQEIVTQPYAHDHNANAEPILEVNEVFEAASDNDWKDCGLPTIGYQADSQILYRTGYITSYNKTTKLPNWVAWKLTSDRTSGPVPRCNNFSPDYDVPAPRQELEDWDNKESEEFDHGHMCPAGDNKWARKAMEETFLLTNICPQNSQLNQETWERLESHCRWWANKYGTIYIVTGPIFRNKNYRTFGNNSIAVPDAFFKVVLRIDGKPQALGFIYENTYPRKKDRMEDHVVPISEIEKSTGLQFFPLLKDNELKSNSNFNKWN